MGTSTTSVISEFPFAVDVHSLDRNSGRQVDWDSVNESWNDGSFEVTLDGEVDGGVTALTVDALPGAVPAGTILDFGGIAGVTVTSNVASAKGAVSLTCNALSGPIPAGTYLDFGVHGTSGDQMLALTTVDAVATDTAIAVADLPEEIQDAKTATYLGGSKLAKVLADAAAGATSLTVDETPLEIEDADTAWVVGPGAKTIPAGTVMAELASGLVKPAADVITAGGAETATSLLETNAVEGSEGDGLTGYGQIVGGAIYQNLLPDSAHGSFATWITALEVAGVGTGWLWETYADDRA